jgi:hypothetical protein
VARRPDGKGALLCLAQWLGVRCGHGAVASPDMLLWQPAPGDAPDKEP